jgi:cobalt-zinc-cadmium efflux system protein
MSAHHHAHQRSNSRAFAIGIALNVAYIAVEFIYGIFAGSLALLADAGHNVSDVLGLLLSWAAFRFAQAAPTTRRTYGLRRTSILAALGNGLLLLVSTGAIVWEGIHRLVHPQPAAGLTIVCVAGAGVVINGITAWLFMAGRKTDLNIRSAFVHMSADAAVSLGVALAGLAIYLTGMLWIDPVVSLVVAAVIGIGTWSLLRDASALAIDSVPKGIDPDAVQSYLADLPGVRGIHHLHIWPMSTTETALTAHLVKPDAQLDDVLLSQIEVELEQRFGICHTTIQFEHEDRRSCSGSVPNEC